VQPRLDGLPSSMPAATHRLTSGQMRGQLPSQRRQQLPTRGTLHAKAIACMCVVADAEAAQFAADVTPYQLRLHRVALDLCDTVNSKPSNTVLMKSLQ
jgi:hypothetical protein